MSENMTANPTPFFASRRGIIVAGAVIGLLAAVLQKLGNPPNMGLCMACFYRDIAGALGLHRAPPVQYIRPEIIGLVFGAVIAAFLNREFRPRTGSAPVVRFLLGMFAMIGALAFLGCPWRVVIRLAGGDLNAVVGLAGLVAGVALGVHFLRSGYSLGRAYKTYPAVGWIMPALMAGLLLLLVLRPVFNEKVGGPIFFSSKGPGAMHAPLLLSLGIGLVIGLLAQRTRFCTMGSFRDVILMRDYHLLTGVAALVVAALVANLILGQVKFGITGQPVAHSSHVWNFLGMVLSGLAFALAGGCPGRQLILAGEGDGDATVFVLGMFMGAGFAHNFMLAATPDKAGLVGGLSTAGMVAVVLGLVVCLTFGFALRERD